MRIDAYNQIQQIYGTKKLTKTEKKAAGASFKDQLMLSATAQDASAAKKHSQQRLTCGRIL